MEVIERTITYTRAEAEYKLYPLGDLHLGTKHCAEEKIKKQVAEIANDPVALWIGMGDYGEFITPRDKRWDVQVIADWVEQDNIATSQTEYIAELLDPIKDKGIGLLQGNHEDYFRLFLDSNVQKNLCKALDLPNLMASSWVKLRFARENSNEKHIIKGVVAHGEGWAITPGAKMNRLQRFMNAFDARFYGLGHMHDIITHTVPYLDLSETCLIKQKERVGAVTGCWFRTYSQGVAPSYGEKKNYPPSSLGCPMFTINPQYDAVKVHG